MDPLGYAAGSLGILQRLGKIQIWEFPWGYPNRWMVDSGKSHLEMMIGYPGTP